MKNLYLVVLLLLVSAFSYGIIGPIIGGPDVCLHAIVHLSDTSTGGVWSSSNPGVATIGSATGDVTGLTLGTTTVVYTVGVSSTSKVIRVIGLPAVYSVTGGGSYCSGGTGVHIGLSGSAAGVSYYLYRGTSVTGPVAGTGSSIDFGLMPVAGTYTVVGTSASTGCSIGMTDSAVVSIIPPLRPVAGITITPGDSVCNGTSCTYHATAINGGTAPVYQWIINGVAAGAGATYTFVPANGDRVKVNLTSNAVCAAPTVVYDSLIMHVTPRRTPIATLSATPGDTICQEYQVTVSVTPTYGGTAPSYKWMFNNSIVATTGTTYSCYPANGDSITCIIHSNYNCLLVDSSRSIPLKITALPPVFPTFYIDAYPGYNIKPGQVLTLSAVLISPATNLSYQWYVNRVAIPTAIHDTFIYNHFDSTGVDSVSCVVTSDGLCSLTTTNWAMITVSDASVNQVNVSEDILLYPNPNSGQFSLKGPMAYNHILLEIADMLGQIIYRQNVDIYNGLLERNFILPENLPNGTYRLILHTGEGKFASWPMGLRR